MNTINKKIRVGIIGVDSNRGWASTAHIPAVRALPSCELVAISNRNHEKLLAASKIFQVPNAFTDSYELINSPEVDLVVVTGKVPYHKELVRPILNADKHVYCEWPSGNGLEEAIDMAELIRQKKLCCAIGLTIRQVLLYVEQYVHFISAMMLATYP